MLPTHATRLKREQPVHYHRDVYLNSSAHRSITDPMPVEASHDLLQSIPAALYARPTDNLRRDQSSTCFPPLCHRYAKPTRTAKTVNHSMPVLRTVVTAPDVPEPMTSSDTVARPTGLLTQFKRSTVSIAGPTLKKSTNTNVGA